MKDSKQPYCHYLRASFHYHSPLLSIIVIGYAIDHHGNSACREGMAVLYHWGKALLKEKGEWEVPEPRVKGEPMPNTGW